MTKTKKIISALAAITLVVLAGCEWGTPSSDETWTMNGYDWFDFSGTYRGATGGPIVTGFSYEDPTTEGVVNGEVISSSSSSQAGQTVLAPPLDITAGSFSTMSAFCATDLVPGSITINIAGGATLRDNTSGGLSISSGASNLALTSGTIDYASGSVNFTAQVITASAFSSSVESTVSYQYGVESAFSGNFAHGSVTPGSVTIFAGDYVFIEISAGILSTIDGKIGTISYATGAWSINLGGIGITGDVTASYEYTIDQPFEPGNTGTPIVTLSISQVGNKLTIIDSMGRTFAGTIGVANGSGGVSQPTSNDDYSSQVMAQFTAYHGDIEIIGTLTGLYTSDDPGVLFNRAIQAVWIEPTVQGDVNGVASAVYVPEFVTATAAAATTTTTTTP